MRRQQKIAAAVNNAARFLEVRGEYGSFPHYIWGFVDGEPVVNHWREQHEVPATSPLSDRLSVDLRARGFKFVGSTIVYSHRQACGLVNDYLVNCFRHRECQEAFSGVPGAPGARFALSCRTSARRKAG